MAPKNLVYNGTKFVPNNFAAVLTKSEVPSELHFIQDFLANSEIGFALTQPEQISPDQVLTFWRTGLYDDGGRHGTPSIVFTVQEVEYVVTPLTVRKALHLPEDVNFTPAVGLELLQNMMASLGYEESLASMGQLVRKHIRREWGFFFDCITKAFGNKCSNFDALPILSQQIGYSLIHSTHFDYARTILCYIGDRMTEDPQCVYFARFVQLIYSFCTEEPQRASTLMPPYKVSKRFFTDLLKIDEKKVNLRPLRVPREVQQQLVNADATYLRRFPDIASQTVQSQPPVQHSPVLQSDIRTSQSGLPPVKPAKKQLKRTSQVVKSPARPEKRRKFVLRDESDEEAQVPVSNPVASDHQHLSSPDLATSGHKKMKRQPKQRARRVILEDEVVSSDTEMEAAVEGDQESLIPEETLSPQRDFSPAHSATPSTSSEIDIHNLSEHATLYLEAPPAL